MKREGERKCMQRCVQKSNNDGNQFVVMAKTIIHTAERFSRQSERMRPQRRSYKRKRARKERERERWPNKNKLQLDPNQTKPNRIRYMVLFSLWAQARLWLMYASVNLISMFHYAVLIFVGEQKRKKNQIILLVRFGQPRTEIDRKRQRWLKGFNPIHSHTHTHHW